MFKVLKRVKSIQSSFFDNSESNCIPTRRTSQFGRCIVCDDSASDLLGESDALANDGFIRKRAVVGRRICLKVLSSLKAGMLRVARQRTNMTTGQGKKPPTPAQKIR